MSRPHYVLQVRERRVSAWAGRMPFWLLVREWRIRDADGWYTRWAPSAADACDDIRAGRVV